MAENERTGSEKAYRNPRFINGADGRALRILAEYMEPNARFEEFNVSDTIVFFGSARLVPLEDANRKLEAARAHGGDVEKAERDLGMARYYEEARTLAHRLTEWSKNLAGAKRRFLVCTGGGPGIMEAANRGASEANGVNIGLNISLPFETSGGPHVTRELEFEFHYFFMRKFWFLYLAKAIVVFPGGFGTLDEFFEILTLIQTRKTKKRMPIVLFGTEFWRDVLNLDALVKYGTISAEDLDLFFETDSVDAAFEHIVAGLEEFALASPGGYL